MFLIAFSLAAVYKRYTCARERKIKQIGSFVYLIRHIRQMIECYAMPVSDIFRGARDEIAKRFAIKGEELNSLTELLDKCELVCGEESEACLRALADTFGKSYRDRQIKLCDATAAELEKIKNKTENDYLPEKKAVAAICLCIGGLILIILL